MDMTFRTRFCIYFVQFCNYVVLYCTVLYIVIFSINKKALESILGIGQ